MSDPFEDAIRAAGRGLAPPAGAPTYHDAWRRGRRRRVIKRSALATAGVFALVVAFGGGLQRLPGGTTVEVDDVAIGSLSVQPTPTSAGAQPVLVPTTAPVPDDAEPTVPVLVVPTVPSASSDPAESSEGAVSGRGSRAEQSDAGDNATAAPQASEDANDASSSGGAPDESPEVFSDATSEPESTSSEPTTPAVEPTAAATTAPTTTADDSPGSGPLGALQPAPVPSASVTAASPAPTSTSDGSDDSDDPVVGPVDDGIVSSGGSDDGGSDDPSDPADPVEPGDDDGQSVAGEPDPLPSPQPAPAPPVDAVQAPGIVGDSPDPAPNDQSPDAALIPGGSLIAGAHECDTTGNGIADATCALLLPYACTAADVGPDYRAIDRDGDGVADWCEPTLSTTCDTTGDGIGDTICRIAPLPPSENSNSAGP